MAAGDLNIALVLKLVDQATGPARAITNTIRKIGAVSEQTGRAGVAWSNQQLAANQARKSALAGEAFGVAAVAGSLAAALSPAINFERSMSEVGAVARADDEQLARLTETARQLGATTPWAASEAAQGMRFLSMAGFDVNQTVDAMPGMLNLASAGAIDLGRAADIASNVLSGFGLEASQMGRLGDVLTNTFTTSNTDLGMLGETMKYVAPNAAALGVSLEQTAAMAGKLGDAGIQGSQAGTALRAMMLRLAALPKPAADAMAYLGVETVDAAGNLRDMPTILAEVQESLQNLGSGEQAKMINDIFGMEAASAATVLLEQAGSGALQKYAESLAEAGSAARVAAKLNDNTAGAIKRLQSMAESAAISIGLVLLPQIVELIETIIPVIDAIRAWADANPELVGLIFKLVAGLVVFRLGSIALRWALFSMMTPILHIIRAGSWMLVLLPRLGAGLMALLNPMKLVRAALIAIRLGFLATGVGALLAGIAMAGIWIYNNWEGLKTFFVGFWYTFREALGPAAPMLDNIINYARQIWDWFVEILGPMEATEEKWLSWGNRAGEVLGGIVGGVGEWIAANKGLVSTIAKLYAAFFVLRLLWRIPVGPIRAAGSALGWLAAGPIKALLTGIGLVGKAVVKLGILMLTNPIGMIIAAVAALAFVVYDNWDRIVSFFMDKVDAVKAAFDEGLLNGVFKLLSEFNPFTLMIEGIQGLIAYVMELVGVPGEIVAAFRGFSLFESGVELLSSLWDGMTSILFDKVDAVKTAFDEGLLNGVFKLLSEFNPFALMIDGMQNLIAQVMELMGVPEEIVAAFREFSLFDTGVELLTGLWDGMASLVPQMVAAISEKLSGIVPDWMKDAWDWAGGDDKPERSTPSAIKTARLAAVHGQVMPTEPEGGRDRGGPVRAGTPYLVGERSPEIFVPGVSGTILPGRVLAAAMAASAIAAPAAAMPSTAAEIDRTIDRQPALSAAAPAPQIVRQGDVININIYPSPGMDAEAIGREVERRLARLQDTRRADLHDGVDY